MSDQLITALKQAKEAMETCDAWVATDVDGDHYTSYRYDIKKVRAAIESASDAIRAANANPPTQQSESVEALRDKWKIVDGDCREGANGLITYHVAAFDEGRQSMAAQPAEPVAWMLSIKGSPPFVQLMRTEYEAKRNQKLIDDSIVTPLYAAAQPAQAQYKLFALLPRHAYKILKNGKGWGCNTHIYAGDAEIGNSRPQYVELYVAAPDIAAPSNAEYKRVPKIPSDSQTAAGRNVLITSTNPSAFGMAEEVYIAMVNEAFDSAAPAADKEKP